MAYQQRDNSGVLFKNDKKTEEKHPDYKGHGIVNGVDVWISAWIKTGKKGKFMSLSFQEKEQKQTSKQSHPKDIPDDDVPF